MVRGRCPSDYLIMVPADPSSLSGLAEKAQQILESGRGAKSSVHLTRREEEVLDGVLRSLANKEIASQLNLSERTVKFHVSSLLAKFKVRSRMELLRESSRLSLKAFPAPVAPQTAEVRPFVTKKHSYHSPLNAGRILPLAAARMMA
jgi:DNA-binding CsgD family transcriptional regulator